MAEIGATHAGIEMARALLKPPQIAGRCASPWAGLAAAGFAAIAAILLAGVMVLGPGLSLSAHDPARSLSLLAADLHSTSD